MQYSSPKYLRSNLIPAALVALIIGLSGCTSKPPEGMVEIPEGDFIMGSEEVDKAAKALQYGAKRAFFVNERPLMKVTLKRYFIDRHEVTNGEYSEFVAATDHRAPSNWGGRKIDDSVKNHPVTHVSWADADSYCNWRGKTLPTEAQWEKAARGTEGNKFPWGNDFNKNNANAGGRNGGTVPVGSYPTGMSPFGVHDMAGNVWEWTADWYKAYPGNTVEDKDYGEKFRVARGGGWGGMGHYSLEIFVRSSYRHDVPPEGRFTDVGFRCAKSD